MRINEINNEIKEAETTIQELFIKLDHFREIIIKDLKPFIETDMKNLVEEEILSNPTYTISLGTETLQKIKHKMKITISKSAEMIDSFYSNDSVWAHKYIFKDTEDGARALDFYNADTVENDIQAGLHYIYGEIGNLLLEYGYIETGKKYPFSETHKWELNPETNTMYYMWKVWFSQRLEDDIAQYQNGIAAVNTAFMNLRNLKKDLLVQEAKDVWDQQ